MLPGGDGRVFMRFGFVMICGWSAYWLDCERMRFSLGKRRISRRAYRPSNAVQELRHFRQPKLSIDSEDSSDVASRQRDVVCRPRAATPQHLPGYPSLWPGSLAPDRTPSCLTPHSKLRIPNSAFQTPAGCMVLRRSRQQSRRYLAAGAAGISVASIVTWTPATGH